MTSVRTPVPVRRLAAGLAVAATALGAVLLTAAVAATPWLRWSGYVSEAGVGPSGHASTYRLGVGGLAAGQALLAVALSLVDRVPPLVPVTVGLLAADSAFGGVSAAVSCSP